MGRKKKQEVVEPFVTEWMELIRAGVDFRKQYSTRKHWDEYRKYYRGQWAEGVVPINKTFSYGRTLVPKVYFRAPRVTVTTTQPELVWHAKVVEALDNLLIKEMMLKYTLKKSVLDSYHCGVGPIKLGYDSEFGYLPEQAIDDSGETVTQVSTKEAGESIEYRQNVKPGMPWALRVRPEDVIVPWGSEDQYNLPWVCHYVLRPLKDVQQDQKYRNTEKLQGTRTPSMADDQRTKSSFRPRTVKDKGVTYCELWEIRDVKTKQIIVISENQLLMSTRDELQTNEGLPWEFVTFNPDPEYFWGIPDVHIIAPQQIELNEGATQAARHRAITLLKFLYLRSAMKEEEVNKLLSGEVGPGVAVDGDTLAAAVQILQPHIPPDLYKDMQHHIQAMREQLGMSQNQEGAFSPYHGKTATESNIVSEASEDRIDERKDIMADVLVRIIRKWNQFLFKFWTEEKVVNIVTPDGEPAWIKYTGDELRGDYLLSIDADSGMPVSQGLKRQLSTEMFKALGGDPLIDQVLLRQIALENYEAIDPRVSQLLQIQPAPEQLAAEIRQPHPLSGGGGGKGAGGGRTGSTPKRPEGIEEFRKRKTSQ